MVFSVALRGREHCIAAELSGALAPALRASTGGGDKSHILTPDYEAYFQYTGNKPSPSDWSEWRVRRLMPVECERLPGMPDHYTQVPYRSKHAAEAPRYKASCNSMAVPGVGWLGRSLIQQIG